VSRQRDANKRENNDDDRALFAFRQDEHAEG
jgi:hypothetical protein